MSETADDIIRRELLETRRLSGDAAVAAQKRLAELYGEDLVIDAVLDLLAESKRKPGPAGDDGQAVR